MRFAIEAHTEPGLFRLWWKQEFNDKPYGQYCVVRLPIDDLTPYLAMLKNGFEMAVSEIELKEEELSLAEKSTDS